MTEREIPAIKRIFDNDNGGVKQNCGECRFWSERVYQCVSGGTIKSICLSEKSRHNLELTTERMVCAEWAVNSLGAVDSTYWDNVNEDPLSAYAVYDEFDSLFPDEDDDNGSI